MCAAIREHQGHGQRGYTGHASHAAVQCMQAAVVALVACACLEACLAVPTGVQRDARHYGRTSSQAQQTTHQASGTYCGSRLSDALKFMCNGQYNSYFKTKKTQPSGEDLAAGGAAKQKRRDDSWIKRETQGTQTQGRARREAEESWTQRSQEDPEGSASQLPFRERLRAAALLDARPSHSRVTRGVFDECCTKSCTLDELMSYCEVMD